ncbi:MAG TPA: transglutaminase family protein [Vicinamibacterales bacterium]|nr:transglutaminase family protein [Vicinamibacterales bacterium]
MSADASPVQYEVVHTTEYDYSESVAVSHHLAHLSPRVLPHQQCLHHELQIEPAPAVMTTHSDYFGNPASYFAMQGAHKRLTVRARSRVSLEATKLPSPSDTPPWEEVADRTALPLEAVEFLYDSALIPASAELEAYARAAFPPARPLLDAVLELTRRIHDEFTFDRKATTVRTPLADVFKSRRGVCQDFARLEIACLRSLGLPARYVSGYLETAPPPGRPRLLGADASHAWLSFYCPEAGWIHVDPTNNVLPSRGHVTVAWGRDYNDVSPIHGVILGGGSHTLRVHVDVLRVEEI